MIFFLILKSICAFCRAIDIPTLDFFDICPGFQASLACFVPCMQMDFSDSSLVQHLMPSCWPAWQLNLLILVSTSIGGVQTHNWLSVPQQNALNHSATPAWLGSWGFTVGLNVWSKTIPFRSVPEQLHSEQVSKRFNLQVYYSEASLRIPSTVFPNFFVLNHSVRWELIQLGWNLFAVSELQTVRFLFNSHNVIVKSINSK